jgi:hypothetical protein
VFVVGADEAGDADLDLATGRAHVLRFLHEPASLAHVVEAEDGAVPVEEEDAAERRDVRYLGPFAAVLMYPSQRGCVVVAHVQGKGGFRGELRHQDSRYS